MRALCLALVVALAFTSSAFADTASRLKDPEQFSRDVFGAPPRIDPAEMAKTIATTVGKPSVADTLEKALKVFDGKKVEAFTKVIDHDFGGVLRQIVYYAYIGDIGFVYFRFNFKMSGTGWILANFNFKSETEELFPKDFITR
jgi:hypothetical protein